MQAAVHEIIKGVDIICGERSIDGVNVVDRFEVDTALKKNVCRTSGQLLNILKKLDVVGHGECNVFYNLSVSSRRCA